MDTSRSVNAGYHGELGTWVITGYLLDVSSTEGRWVGKTVTVYRDTTMRDLIAVLVHPQPLSCFSFGHHLRAPLSSSDDGDIAMNGSWFYNDNLGENCVARIICFSEYVIVIA